MKVVSVVVNWALPLDDRLIAVKVWSYKRVREGQRDGGYRIIPVIADVGRAWHDGCRRSELSCNGLTAGILLRCNFP